MKTEPAISAAALNKRFLVVEDERIVAEDISECLIGMGGKVVGQAITGEEAIRLAEQHQPDLVLMDICLQGQMEGTEAALIMRKRWQIPAVFLTAYSDSGALERAKQADPVGYIVKPFDEASLRSAVEIALHRCEMDRSLRDNREWFVTILTGMEDGVIVTDLEGRITFMNPAAEALTGWGSLQVIGQPVANVCPLYDAETGRQLPHPALRVLSQSGSVSPMGEGVLLRADKSLRPVDISGGAVRDRMGEATGAVLLIRDVTQARQTTQQLRHHQQHLETLVQERTSKIVQTNQRLLSEIEERKRIETSLAIRAKLESLVNSISAEFLAMPPGGSDECQLDALGKIGDELGADCVCLYLIHDQRAEISCTHEWLAPGVATRQSSFQAQPYEPSPPEHRKSLLRHPHEENGGPSLADDIARARAKASLLMAPLFEHERLLGYLSLESGTPREWSSVAIDLLRMTVGPFSHMLNRCRSDREKRRLQDQLTRAQRMEAVGRLSGGIAHDFNNTLLPIIGYADMLLSRLEEDDPIAQDLGEIRRAAQHAATLTRQLLAFSKKQVVNKITFDFNEELCTMRNLLQRIIGENIVLETCLDKDLPPLLADPGQIQQVVMNLVVNARDAMPEGGRITLRTCVVDPDRERIPLPVSGADGARLVRLSVEDTGTGIPPEIRDRIFDPFFSTKGSEGTGLGLSVIFSILEQHGGGIDFESETGRGTTFHVYLPISDKPAPASIVHSSTRDTMPLGHGQRILLIEDEEAVNRFVTVALSKHGYEVVSAANVGEAWDVFEQERGRLDMIFSDAVLPDGNGVDLIGRVLGAQPEMKALLSSGYTDKDALLRLAQEREISFLQKPYTLPDLLRTVDEVLHGTHEAVLN